MHELTQRIDAPREYARRPVVDREWPRAVIVALPLIAAVLGLALLAVGNLDERIAARFFDASSGTWPWRHEWVVSSLLHQHGRDAVAAIGGTMLVLLVASTLVVRLRPHRRRFAFALCAILLSTGGVAGLKALSAKPCPRDAAEFGGELPDAGAFELVSDSAQGGHCFPGAHASGGFSLMAFYFVFRDRSRRLALAALLTGFLVGCVFGAAQVVRGAHYPSHNLWSCVLVWSLCIALYHIAFRGRLAPSVAPPSPDDS